MSPFGPERTCNENTICQLLVVLMGFDLNLSGLKLVCMDSDSGNRGQHRFSDRPVLHYVLAICITSIIVAFVLSLRTYDCLSSGNTYDCSYDPGSPGMIGFGASAPNLSLVLHATVRISLYLALLWVVTLLITNIPIYSLAHYVGYRYRIKRNILGVIFWMIAWTLAFLTLPILIAIQGLLYPSHVSLYGDLVVDLEFGIAGVVCGIAYCALAFLHRTQT
jgi:hypothetical protein